MFILTDSVNAAFVQLFTYTTYKLSKEKNKYNPFILWNAKIVNEWNFRMKIAPRERESERMDCIIRHHTYILYGFIGVVSHKSSYDLFNMIWHYPHTHTYINIDEWIFIQQKKNLIRKLILLHSISHVLSLLIFATAWRKRNLFICMKIKLTLIKYAANSTLISRKAHKLESIFEWSLNQWLW